VARKKTPANPDGYQFVSADPPWKMNNYGLAKHGAARSHYDLMTLDQLKAVELQPLLAKNCLLGLWSLGTKEAEGAHHELAAAWGFRLTTRLLVWIKANRKCTGCKHDWDAHEPDPWNTPGRCTKVNRKGDRCPCLCLGLNPHFGPGCYTGQNAEVLWLGVRGSGFSKGRARRDVRSVLIAPMPTYAGTAKKKHSAKPGEAYRRIEILWPELKRLELFRRGEARPGWDAAGDQADGGIPVAGLRAPTQGATT
jgi:N6-adenosine-specific RNA methylase IME4